MDSTKAVDPKALEAALISWFGNAAAWRTGLSNGVIENVEQAMRLALTAAFAAQGEAAQPAADGWEPIGTAEKSVDVDMNIGGVRLLHSYPIWARWEKGPAREVSWCQRKPDNPPDGYWWDWEAEDICDPDEWFPHPLASPAASRDRERALERERDEARSIVRDIYWMAVRYADGRKSYAPGMCNDAIRKAYDGGWLAYRDDKQHDLDPQYARPGDESEYRSVEARADAAEAEVKRLREALGKATVDCHHCANGWVEGMGAGFWCDKCDGTGRIRALATTGLQGGGE